jgi:hypothetical protein
MKFSLFAILGLLFAVHLDRAISDEIPVLDSFLNESEFGVSPYHPYLDDTQLSITKLWFNVQELDKLRAVVSKNFTRVDKMQIELKSKNGILKTYEFYDFGARPSGRGSRGCPTFHGNFLIELDAFIPDQEFRHGDGSGLRKFKIRNPINCVTRDFSYLKEKLTADIMASAGIVVPRISYTDLYINEKYYGLYLVQEEIDHKFLKNRDALVKKVFNASTGEFDLLYGDLLSATSAEDYPKPYLITKFDLRNLTLANEFYF